MLQAHTTATRPKIYTLISMDIDFSFTIRNRRPLITRPRSENLVVNTSALWPERQVTALVSGNIWRILPVIPLERGDGAMRFGRIGWMGVFGVLAVGMTWGAVRSSQDGTLIRPVLQRMVALENPLVLSQHVLPWGTVPSPAMKRRLWQAELRELSRTFAPGSPLFARDRHIYRVTMAVIAHERMTYERIHITLESVVAVGPWARATWRARVAFSNAVMNGNSSNLATAHHSPPVLDGTAGAALLRQVHGHWRVVTYSEHYIPGEGP